MGDVIYGQPLYIFINYLFTFLFLLGGKGFAYKNGIKEHKCVTGVTKVTEVQCDKCSSVFKREMDYVQHHKAQHGGFPAHLEHKVKYLCDVCPAAYTTYVGLYLHRRKNHNTSGKDKQPKTPRQIHTCKGKNNVP